MFCKSLTLRFWDSLILFKELKKIYKTLVDKKIIQQVIGNYKDNY